MKVLWHWKSYFESSLTLEIVFGLLNSNAFCAVLLILLLSNIFLLRKCYIHTSFKGCVGWSGSTISSIEKRIDLIRSNQFWPHNSCSLFILYLSIRIVYIYLINLSININYSNWEIIRINTEEMTKSWQLSREIGDQLCLQFESENEVY